MENLNQYTFSLVFCVHTSSPIVGRFYCYFIMKQNYKNRPVEIELLLELKLLK